MAEKLKRSVKSLVEEANAEIVTLTVEEAIGLHGDPGVVLIDIRDPRELARDGAVPGAFHAPRGMLEFWIDPESPYFKPVFGEDKRFVFFLRRRVSFRPDNQDFAGYGIGAGRPHRRRVWRLEGRRRPG